MLRTDGEPCQAFAPGDGSQREVKADRRHQWMAGHRLHVLKDCTYALQHSEAAAPRSKIVIVPSCAPRCSGLTASLVMPSRLAMDHEARFTRWDLNRAQEVAKRALQEELGLSDPDLLAP